MQLNSDTGRKIKQINREAEERDAKRRAEKTGFPYLDLATAPLEVDALGILTKEEAEHARLAVLAKNRQTLVVIVYNPEAPETQSAITELKNKKFTPNISVVSLSGLKHVWGFYDFLHKIGGDITGKVDITEESIVRLRDALNTLQKTGEEIGKVEEENKETGKLLEVILSAALILGASDIHLEPEEYGTKFRLRIDGALHDVYAKIKNENYNFLISRIKLFAGLKLNIRESSQDGRFTIGFGKKEVEIRVAILPSEYGETIVLRILDPETIQLKLKDLGLRPDDEKLIADELLKPNGMILNTGPTGSGKTTTLYAFLLHVKTPEIKIITIENPIEYRLQGVEQTQVEDEAGYTFGNGLRAIVRQDPDVILVGEIRDFETAEIGMQAALTGHLVFSTLHTNDSFGAVPRLIELGVKPVVIGPALNLVIAQRLLRRLCEYCKVKEELSADIKKHIGSFFKNLAERVDKEKYKNPDVYKAVGCEKCSGIGYKGRIAIFEFLKIDDDLEQLIYKDVSEVSLKEAARKQGIVTLQDDGILKVLEGVSTFSEVLDITGPIEWYAADKK